MMKFQLSPYIIPCYIKAAFIAGSRSQESGAHLLGCSYNAVVSNMIGGNYQSPWRIKPREARLPAHLRAKVIAKEASRDDAEAAGLGWAPGSPP